MAVRGPGLGARGPGRTLAFDETVGVQIHGFGELALVLGMPNLHGTSRRGTRIVAQGDPFADQGGIDLVEGAIETDSAILLHLAGGLEQEQLIEILGGRGETHRLGALRPALQRRLAVEAAVRRVMVFRRQPYLQAAVECLEAVAILRGQTGQELRAQGAKKALDFPFSLGPIRSGMN